MPLNDVWNPLLLSLKLAAVSTLLLLFLCAPLSWWLARSRSKTRSFIEAAVALPIVLPPSVLGFYLLICFAPDGPLGRLSQSIGGPQLAFSFTGLVLGSILYSLPFVAQPMQSAFRSLDEAQLEAAATLGAGPLDRFCSIVLPQAKRGILSAATLGFAHTLGEFGVVLMIGGSIPGETRTLSIAIFEHVEALDYGNAHLLSAIMLVLSFTMLLLIYATDKNASLFKR